MRALLRRPADAARAVPVLVVALAVPLLADPLVHARQAARAIAATGVDLISVGALTHSAPSLDISLNFVIGDS